MPLSTEYVWMKCKDGAEPVPSTSITATPAFESGALSSDEEDLSDNDDDSSDKAGQFFVTNVLRLSLNIVAVNTLDTWRDPNNLCENIKNKKQYKLNPNLRVVDTDGSVVHPKDYEKKLPEGTLVVVDVTLKLYVLCFNCLLHMR